eukprot:gene2136-3067_t
MRTITFGHLVRVAITDACSFVGAHTAKFLLERGYHVRAIVASEAERKAPFLVARCAILYAKEDLAAAYGGSIEVCVADLSRPGSFSSLLDKCQFVVIKVRHPSKGKDGVPPPPLLDAPQIVRNLLSACTVWKSILRVVLIGSYASVHHHPYEHGRGHVITEEDWNHTSTPSTDAYFASCIATEKLVNVAPARIVAVLQAAWEFMKASPEPHFHLSVILATYV